MQAAANVPQGLDGIVLPFLVDGNQMVDVGVVAHDVSELFIDDEGDVRARGVTAQDLQKGSNEDQVA